MKKADVEIHITPGKSPAGAEIRMNQHLTKAPGEPEIPWVPGTTRDQGDGVLIDLRKLDPRVKYLFVAVTRVPPELAMRLKAATP